MRLAISTIETLTDLKTDLVVANNSNYVFPCPAIIRLTFTFLNLVNDAQTLLAGFSEHLL